MNMSRPQMMGEANDVYKLCTCWNKRGMTIVIFLVHGNGCRCLKLSDIAPHKLEKFSCTELSSVI